MFWRNIQKLKGDLSKKQKIILNNREGELMQGSREIEQKFRSIWEKVFKITEEDEEKFNGLFGYVNCGRDKWKGKDSRSFQKKKV